MIEFSTSAASAGAEILTERMAEHEGLVRWVVRRQWLGGMPFEDALHEGRIGLWHALQHYDPSRGTTFSTYAVPAVAHAVWRAVVLHRRLSSPTSAPTTLDPPPEPVEVIHQDQVHVALLDLIGQLPLRLHQVIVAHYGLDGDSPHTFTTIGGRLGLTRQRIQQLHVDAILWLAHPAHSVALRQVLGLHRKLDYQQTLARQRQVTRQRRSWHSPLRRLHRRGVSPQPKGG